MGFLSGGISFLRFKVAGAAPRKLDGDHLDKLDNHSAGKVRIKSPGGIEVGWVAGEHILDVGFVEHKNVLPHALIFGMRIDLNKLPGDLLHAYYAEELRVLERESEKGFVSAREKRQAKDTARDKLEDEAKDGRFLKRKAIPVLWDRLSNEVLFGATSTIQTDRFRALFEQTFHREVELVGAGGRAFHLAEARGQTRQVDDGAPSAFVPGITPPDFAWIADESSRDFLGNEFLLWLWYRSEVHGDAIKAADNTEITFMIARSLTLDCPRGQTGQASLTHEAPCRMGEAAYGIRVGKLPRSCGLTLVRNSQQYECTIDAETFGVGAAKLARAVDLVDLQAVREDRVAKLRDFIETLDLLYDAFGRVRLGREWEQELKGMQQWLKKS